MATAIFDLDHTLIDSSHRQVTRDDGSLCLDSWRAKSTRTYIFGDSLIMPMIGIYASIAARCEVIICTARVMTDNDVDFLEKHNIEYDFLLSRDGPNDMRGDAQLKIEKLSPFFGPRRKDRAMMFDDNLSVIRAINEWGIKCYNAKDFY